MGGIYERGNRLWVWYLDAAGSRRWEKTGLPVSERQKAEKVLAVIERRIEAERLTGIPAGELTVKAYGEKWLEARPRQDVATADDEARRLRLHAWPLIGHLLLKDARPRHVRDMVRALRTKKSARGTALAPRTVRHVYSTLHTMFREAVVDELLSSNPCVLKKDDLPAKVDKDPTWRNGAVFTRDEAEQLFSDPRIPDDRRTINALELLGGLRGGEDTALHWRDYDTQTKPLGMLTVALNWDSRKKRETSTKTEVVRYVPVHPTLAKILNAWKLGGWARLFGRPPGPDDLIVPNRDGEHRNGQRAIRRFHSDLAKLGLRKRRKHDCRRTFITLARADGARSDILKWVTHAPPKGMMDLYSSLPWETLCAEVSRLRLDLRVGQLLEFRQLAVGSCDSPCDSLPSGSEKAPNIKSLGAFSNEREKGFEPAPEVRPALTEGDKPADSQANATPADGQNQAKPCDTVTNVTPTHEGIGAALALAYAAWVRQGDGYELRRQLEGILGVLEEAGR